MKHRIIAIFAVIAVLAGMAHAAHAQMPGAVAHGDTTVSLVTMYAGHDIYELEGHTAIRITMPGGDVAVSYGTFDFDQPNFVYRFVKGETDYWVSLWPWAPFEEAYRMAGRRIVQQNIAMTSAQKQALLDIVADNLRPENRTYRYNYVKDNCATRPLRVIERALGDSIMLGAVPAEYAHLSTWRRVMTHCHAHYPWYQFGIDLALGPGIDRNIDNRELAFAPVILAGQLETATVAGHKVVADTIVLNDVDAHAAVDAPTPWPLTPLCVMWMVCVLVCAACVVMLRRRKVLHWVYSVFYGVLGLVGCLLAFLIFVSVHEATSPNPLFAAFNPACLIGAIALFFARGSKLMRFWSVINIVLIVAMVAAYVIFRLPLNAAFWPILLADVALSATYIALCRIKN